LCLDLPAAAVLESDDFEEMTIGLFKAASARRRAFCSLLPVVVTPPSCSLLEWAKPDVGPRILSMWATVS
jgi:hypothetical protein